MNPTDLPAFAGLWERLGYHSSTLVETYERLAAAYSAPRRHYHTLDHIGWGLRRIDEMAADDKTRGSVHMEREWDLIRLAFWFHDRVLEGSPSDEHDSAMVATRAIELAGAEIHDCNTVTRLIKSTGHDRIPLRFDEARICDADLSILGAPVEAFDEYERNVRKEWEHVPEQLFRPARSVILRRFVDRPWIYMTDYARERWERPARANLARSLEKLKAAP